MTVEPPVIEPPVKLSTIYHADGSTSHWLLWGDQYWRASSYEYRMIQKGVLPTQLGMFPYEDTTDEA